MSEIKKRVHKDDTVNEIFHIIHNKKWNDGIIYAATHNLRDLAILCIERTDPCTSKFYMDSAMGESAYQDNPDMIKLFIENGANDWNLGLYRAVEKGNNRLVNFFIKQGARDCEYAFYIALEYGHVKLAAFFWDQLAKKGDIFKLKRRERYQDTEEVLEEAMYRASRGNHISSVAFLVERGVDEWYFGFLGACAGGDCDLIMFLAKRAKVISDYEWNLGLNHAAMSGKIENIQLVMKNGYGEKSDVDVAMAYAAKGGHMEAIEYFMSLGAKHWARARQYARSCPNREIYDFFCKKMEEHPSATPSGG